MGVSQVATAAPVTPTLCSEDSAPQQRLKTKWCASPFRDRQAHSRRCTGQAGDLTLIPVIWTWQKRKPWTAASLAAFPSPAVWSSSKNLHPSTGLSFSTQEALRVHKAGSRSASSVNKGDRSDSGTVIMFICGRYVLSTNGSKLFISSHWLFQASEDLVSLSIFTSTKIYYRQRGVSKHSVELEPGPWLL